MIPATSLAGAREALAGESEPPALILADYYLSDDETGVGAIAALREEHGAQLPAMLLSADSAAAAKEQARRHGLLLLRKPIAPSRLRVALGHVLESGGPH